MLINNTDFVACQADLQTKLGDGDVVVLFVGDELACHRPICVICGFHLPNLSDTGECAVADVLRTLLHLRGIKSSGRHLLNEEPWPVDGAENYELSHRLLQLYGE